MALFCNKVIMDDIPTTGKAERIRKCLNNCKDGKGKEDKFRSNELMKKNISPRWIFYNVFIFHIGPKLHPCLP